MSPLSSAPAAPVTTAYPRVDASEASRPVVSERSAARLVEAANAQSSAKSIGLPAAAAGAMNGLSTVAVASAMGSLPAALGRMFDIALAAGSGTLTEADRATLQTEYAQLSKQVASSVGSVSAGAQGSSTSDKGGDKDAASHDPRSKPDDGTGRSTNGYQAPARAVRAKTATPVSAVGAGRAEAANPQAHAVASRGAAGRAANVAQFQQPAAPARSRISVVA